MAQEDDGNEEALDLAKKAVRLVQELGEEGSEPCLRELRDAQVQAERLLAQGPDEEALKAALPALEAMVQAANANGLKAHLVRAKLREVLWVAKDAVALFKDFGDKRGLAVAQQTLARIHLFRSSEPDAPIVALKLISEALQTFRELKDLRREAQALRVEGDAHLAKASASPFEKVKEEEVAAALKTTKDAAALFRKLGDRRSEGLALHNMATSLLAFGDDERIFEGERLAEDALTLFREAGEKYYQAQATFTIINILAITSGPETAAMMAKDVAADWRTEGGQQENQATALHMAANLHLDMGEVTEATGLLQEAERLFNAEGKRRGVAGVLQTRHRIHVLRNENSEAVKALKEAAAIFRDLGDKRAEGGALTLVADILLGALAKDVDTDTRAEQNNKAPPLGLSTEDVYARGEDGMNYAMQAIACFEEIGDTEGKENTEEVIRIHFSSALTLYTEITEPDHIFTNLEVDGNTAKDSTMEWTLELPTFSKKAEEGQKGKEIKIRKKTSKSGGPPQLEVVP